jgi:hypothetical protein
MSRLEPISRSYNVSHCCNIIGCHRTTNLKHFRYPQTTAPTPRYGFTNDLFFDVDLGRNMLLSESFHEATVCDFHEWCLRLCVDFDMEVPWENVSRP